MKKHNLQIFACLILLCVSNISFGQKTKKFKRKHIPIMDFSSPFLAFWNDKGTEKIDYSKYNPSIFYSNNLEDEGFILPMKCIQYAIEEDNKDSVLIYSYRTWVSENPVNLIQYACFLNDTIRAAKTNSGESIPKSWIPKGLMLKEGKYSCDKEMEQDAVTGLTLAAGDAFCYWATNFINSYRVSQGLFDIPNVRVVDRRLVKSFPSTPWINTGSYEVWVKDFYLKHMYLKGNVLFPTKGDSTSEKRVFYICISELDRFVGMGF